MKWYQKLSFTLLCHVTFPIFKIKHWENIEFCDIKYEKTADMGKLNAHKSDKTKSLFCSGSEVNPTVYFILLQITV